MPEVSHNTDVAFVGLGSMGGGMARNLIKGGFKVCVFDVAEARLTPFREIDCRIAGSARDAAAGARVVMCSLPDVVHVEAALFGTDGACETLTEGGLVIDTSTISASASDRICAEVRGRGFRFIDAPIGRTPRDAAAGTALVIVGADKADLEEARPLFACIGNRIVHAGPNGAGIRLKLVNNYMAIVGAMLAAEALTLANKAGLDRAVTVEVLSNTTAGRGQLIVNYPNKVLAGDVVADFPIRMAHKDVSHALSLGADTGVSLMLGAVAREAFNLAKPWHRENEDYTAMLLLLEDIARAEHLAPIYPDKNASVASKPQVDESPWTAQ
jgi:4-hydroxybutyrate dehydrogenase / sulfolactaldehyde 3-reductase